MLSSSPAAMVTLYPSFPTPFYSYERMGKNDFFLPLEKIPFLSLLLSSLSSREEGIFLHTKEPGSSTLMESREGGRESPAKRNSRRTSLSHVFLFFSLFEVGRVHISICGAFFFFLVFFFFLNSCEKK